MLAGHIVRVRGWQVIRRRVWDVCDRGPPESAVIVIPRLGRALVLAPHKGSANEVGVPPKSVLGSPPAVDQIVFHKRSIGRDDSAW